jgi:two-component system, OmpR family, sensor histidine kinase MprB
VTLRARIAAAAGLAVAVAVVAAAIVLYLAVRSDLRGQIDRSLTERAQALVAAPSPPPFGPQRAGAEGFDGRAAFDRGHGSAGSGADSGRRGFPRAVQPARFGGASGYVEFVAPAGTVQVPGGQSASPSIAPNAKDRAIAASGRGRAWSDRTVKGTHLRVLTVGGGARGAVLIARPLTEVDHELSEILLILLLVGVAGIGTAALLGALVARTALAPIARFTARAETLAGSLDLAQRLEVTGRDELARLAGSFNATLDALERSVEAQRHLIADASHELRTPIASLRANIQTLQEAERLAPEDREGLRRDIIDELDELTALVSDVVELARGSRSEATREEVRLDEIVSEAVERTRRRGEVRFAVELQPTVVRAEPERVNRAVTNLLDNARRWSPPDGLIEVGLRDGVLTVRDHGPGFEEADLPHVFERFYRAAAARKLPGSGLGLAIVRQAAEAHHGYARAENAPGGGARLRVSFGTPVDFPAALQRPAPLGASYDDASSCARGVRSWGTR